MASPNMDTDIIHQLDNNNKTRILRFARNLLVEQTKYKIEYLSLENLLQVSKLVDTLTNIPDTPICDEKESPDNEHPYDLNKDEPVITFTSDFEKDNNSKEPVYGSE